eukprot:m.56518 g.56518  ORF g.56518 m.56518 type:complete len:140 (-) comp18757_c0_seq1:152-571(-)
MANVDPLAGTLTHGQKKVLQSVNTFPSIAPPLSFPPYSFLPSFSYPLLLSPVPPPQLTKLKGRLEKSQHRFAQFDVSAQIAHICDGALQEHEQLVLKDGMGNMAAIANASSQILQEKACLDFETAEKVLLYFREDHKTM